MTQRRADGGRARTRPKGEVVWIHRGVAQPEHCVRTLAGRIADERPGTEFVLTSDEPVAADDGHEWLRRPADYPRAVGDFLAIWRPDVAVWIGGPLWPVLAAKTRQAGVPMVLANATGELATGHRAIPARELLGLFETIGACGPADAAALERAGRRPVDVIGPLQASPRPLDYEEDEDLTEALRARPVWYAANATEPEIEALGTATSIGQGASHRLLLIAQPAGAEARSALLQRYGARRSSHRVPPAGAAGFIADVPGEEGLWYRLASVSFVGGTLGGPQAAADPLAAAALGSAILHGPVLDPYRAHFNALRAAGATRPIRDAAGLGRAVADLLAPDRAATLAHHGWMVASEGAEATDHVVEEACRFLDRVR